jgi:hypothetical protein
LAVSRLGEVGEQAVVFQRRQAALRGGLSSLFFDQIFSAPRLTFRLGAAIVFITIL